MNSKTHTIDDDPQIYISPKNLAKRWTCSRSSVDRIAFRNKIRRVMLGEGHNGIVRYLMEDVLRFEDQRTA
ncbi:MAG: hypothetical protein ACE37H_03570 [Phycisphaeraceae bacterium]